MNRVTKLALGVALSVSFFAGSIAAQQDPTGSRRTGETRPVAQQDGQVEQRTVRLPLSRIEFTQTKRVDPLTGNVTSEARDGNGRLVDVTALTRYEEQLRLQTPASKLDQALASAMAAAGEGEALQIGVWLLADGSVLDDIVNARLASLSDDPSHEEVDAAEMEIAEAIIAKNAQTVAPFVTFLNDLGLPVRYASTTAPVVFTTATPSQISAMTALPQVSTLYLETLDREDHNNDAHITHATERVHEVGVRGRGMRVAVLENNGIDPACPYLNVTQWFNAASPNPDNHVHGTAGCIASQLSSRLGASPDVSLYSANAASYSDANVMAAADWIATRNIDATNMSFGGGTGGATDLLERYFDYQSRFFQDSYVASAGNAGVGNNVGSPGISRNCITVGAIDNFDSGAWDDDAMASYSASQDPNNGCEKPNVVAVGSRIDTLGDGASTGPGSSCPGFSIPGSWLINGYCGTSFSSPLTCGNLANAMSVDSTLRTSPEAAMAMMMATAWHNIEGSSRLSEIDGAGCINGYAAVQAGRKGQATFVTVTPSSFSTNGYYTRNITLKGGQRTRVAIGWGVQANAAYTSSVLDADLDLAVFAGSNQTSGASFGFSSSFNNNFEIIEFTAPTTGTYTVRVNDFRFDGASERLGIAWSQKYDDTSASHFTEVTAENSPKAGPTIGNTSYGMRLTTPRHPNQTYICYPSGSFNQGLPLSTHSWSPLAIDVWTQLWLDNGGGPYWTNSAGTTSSSGIASGFRMSIPNLPWLVGFPLHHVAVTLDPSVSTDGLGEISQVHSFELWPDGVDQTRTDDGNIPLALPFGFRFYGTNYTQCFVNMNGNVTFGAASSDFTETAAEFLSGAPRIAAVWDDLEPNSDGAEGTPNVRFRSITTGLDQVVIEFIDVGEYLGGAGATGANTFRIILKDDNSITLQYIDCNVDDCLVGISPGNGLSSASEIDISSSGYRSFSTNAAIFEKFDGAPDGFDLQGADFSIILPTLTNTGDDGLILLPTFSTRWRTVKFLPTTSLATRYRLEVDLD